MPKSDTVERLQQKARFLFYSGMLLQPLYCRSENQEVWVQNFSPLISKGTIAWTDIVSNNKDVECLKQQVRIRDQAKILSIKLQQQINTGIYSYLIDFSLRNLLANNQTEWSSLKENSPDPKLISVSYSYLIKVFETTGMYYFEHLISILYESAFIIQMKEQSEVNILSSQQPNKKMVRRPSKKQLQFMVQSLIKRRQEHEARIDKLVGRVHSQDLTQESKTIQEEEFSQILKQLQNSENFSKQDSKMSAGAFSNHVNLLATVSLQTEYFLIEPAQQKIKNKGKLISSLVKDYGANKITCIFGDSKTSSQLSEALTQTVQYLRAEEIEEGLFVETNKQQTSDSFDYRGTRFSLGKYEQVQLSIQELKQQEKTLVLAQQSNEKTLLNIGWLLLSRLINKKDIIFPETLNFLFSYPVKTFKITYSLGLITFNQLLGQLNKVEEQYESNSAQKIKIFGIQEKTGGSYEIENLSKAKNIKHYAQIVHRFSKLALVIEEELPVKHIPLSCLENHFVVVSLSVKTRGRYFLSVGSATNLSQFRVHILDSSQNVINGGSVKNGEFIFSSLKQETYEVYIYPQPKKAVEGDMEQSFQLVKDQQYNFTFWIQSRQIFSKNGDLSFEIRLKEEYNHFTATIARNYLKKVSHNYENEQQLLAEQQQTVIIRREALSSLSLFVDTYFCGQKRLEVVYKGVNNLTDQNFRENKAIVKNGQSLVLYNNADIQSLSYINGKVLEKVNYRFVINYL